MFDLKITDKELLESIKNAQNSVSGMQKIQSYLDSQLEPKTVKELVNNIVKNLKKQKFLKESISCLKKGCTPNERLAITNLYKRLLEASQDFETHELTGINVLEEFLKKIVPIIERDFRMLTTDQAQRTSYRAHIINAVQNTLASQNLYLTVPAEIEAQDQIAAMPPPSPEAPTGVEEPLMEQEGEIKPAVAPEPQQGAPDQPSTPTDEEKFIDIYGLKKRSDIAQKEQQEEIEFSIFSLDGHDETGRNVAFKTFKRLQPQLVDYFSMLANDRDREFFTDYLIANLKLYFDKFEEELQLAIPEPTNEVYDNAKAEESMSEPMPEPPIESAPEPEAL